jgi:hypothetical protein
VEREREGYEEGDMVGSIRISLQEEGMAFGLRGTGGPKPSSGA